MLISAIAIISKNRGLGVDNHLLFYVPGELPRFKKITMGHPVIMGRRTHDSIGKPLPGRLNIVITRNGGTDIPGALVFVDSLEKALEIARDAEETRVQNVISNESEKSPEEISRDARDDNGEIFILGGGQIFKEALPLTDRLYLTIVEKEVPADTFFPAYESEFTKVIAKEEHTEWDYPYTFLTLEK